MIVFHVAAQLDPSKVPLLATATGKTNVHMRLFPVILQSHNVSRLPLAPLAPTHMGNEAVHGLHMTHQTSLILGNLGAKSTRFCRVLLLNVQAQSLFVPHLLLTLLAVRTPPMLLHVHPQTDLSPRASVTMATKAAGFGTHSMQLLYVLSQHISS